MENIFENAKFGDKFKTMDGRLAIYAGIAVDNLHYLIPENSTFTYGYNDDGTLSSKVDTSFNIVSKIEEHPKHSRFIYEVGSEPIFKVGDTIAYWDTCNDFEGEFIFGKITAIEFDDYGEDWMYTFKDGDYENFETEEQLLQLRAYSIEQNRNS